MSLPVNGSIGTTQRERYRVSALSSPLRSASLRPSFPLFNKFNNEETLRQFTCFKELPTEIRLQVWRLACPVPRIVDIDLCPVSKVGIDGYITPTLLSVCHESRELVRE